MNTFDLNSFFPKDKFQLTKVEQTKETIHIPASKAPKFKAMKSLKEKVNN